MLLNVNEKLFGPLWTFIEDENVTDIKWNGSNLWVSDLRKGKYMVYDGDSPMQLDSEFIKIFCSKVANSVNENFNISSPSLKAETAELRVQAEHNSVSGDDTIALAIRKTPNVSRLDNGKTLEQQGYADKMTELLIPCLMRGHCSGIVTGDVGSGKTELEKYMAKFIPAVDGIVTVEDTLELKLKILYPLKDVYSMRITDTYTNEMAIRDALRLLTKWLIIAESRGRDIARVMEGASTGCCALTSIHAENAWEIPDRIMNMVGDEARAGFENDVYTFFDYAIKVKADITNSGIHRSIDQLCFFDRDNGINQTIHFIEDGKWTGNQLPTKFVKRLANNKSDPDFATYEVPFITYYRKALDSIKTK